MLNRLLKRGGREKPEIELQDLEVPGSSAKEEETVPAKPSVLYPSDEQKKDEAARILEGLREDFGNIKAELYDGKPLSIVIAEHITRDGMQDRLTGHESGFRIHTRAVFYRRGGNKSKSTVTATQVDENSSTREVMSHLATVLTNLEGQESVFPSMNLSDGGKWADSIKLNFEKICGGSVSVYEGPWSETYTIA